MIDLYEESNIEPNLVYEDDMVTEPHLFMVNAQTLNMIFNILYITIWCFNITAINISVFVSMTFKKIIYLA